MDDLTAFITARLDEDEAPIRHDIANLHTVLDGDGLERAMVERRRALREVAAKRAIVARHHADSDLRWPDCSECSCEGALAATDCLGTVSWPCATVLAIATVWSDHPDYRAEWAR